MLSGISHNKFTSKEMGQAIAEAEKRLKARCRERGLDLVELVGVRLGQRQGKDDRHHHHDVFEDCHTGSDL